MLHAHSPPRRWDPWTSSQKHRRHRPRQNAIGMLTPDRIGDHLVARCMALADFRARKLSNSWLPGALGGSKMALGSRHVLQGIVAAVDDQVQAVMAYENETNPLVRLVQTGYITQQITRLNRLLDAAFAVYGIREPRGMTHWQAAFLQERDERMKRFQALTANKAFLADALGGEQRQLELLTLLVYDYQKHADDTYTALEREVVSSTYEACIGLSGLVIASVPSWFVPAYELRNNRWQGSQVNVEQLIRATEERCIREASSWWDLHHPNMMKLFGACHVGKSLVLVREKAQCVKSARSSLPSRDVLLGTAHVLEFLHERHVTPSTLTLESLFSTGKERKVMLHGGDLLTKATKPSMLRARKHTPSPVLPTRPIFLRNDEWTPIEEICADNPVTRGEVSYVMQQIEERSKPAHWHIWNRKRHPVTRTMSAVVTYTQSYVDPTCKLSAEELFHEITTILDGKTEVVAMDSYVCKRLMNVHRQLLGSTRSREVIRSLFDILERFKWSLIRREDSSFSSFCVASSRSMEHCSLSFHAEIDALVVRCGLATAPIHDWKPHCAYLRQTQQDSFRAALEDLVKGLDDDEERAEAATLLLFEATRHRSSYDVNQLRAIECTATSIAGRHGNRESIVVPTWFIPRYEVVVGGRISAGSFGAVHHGKWLNATVAVKCLFRCDRQLFMREANIWFTLNHPNVVKLYGACHVGKSVTARSLDEPTNHTDQRPFFVCEYASEGTLNEYLKRQQQEHKSRSDAWRCLRETAQGLQHLHERGIIHGDLKGNNILVGSGHQLKLTDFGLSTFAKNSTESTGTVGAIRWKAPERLRKLDRGPSFASDIYSFGMCIIEAVTGTFPWRETMDEDLVISEKLSGKLPPRPVEFSDEQWCVVRSMCCLNPADRLSISAVVALLGSLM